MRCSRDSLLAFTHFSDQGSNQEDEDLLGKAASQQASFVASEQRIVDVDREEIERDKQCIEREEEHRPLLFFDQISLDQRDVAIAQDHFRSVEALLVFCSRWIDNDFALSMSSAIRSHTNDVRRSTPIVPV